MKRVVPGVLILLMIALPTFAQRPSVAGARCVALEHVRGGWRMEIKCDQSKGVIVMLDAQKYVGDGMFNGWSQAELKAFYHSLVPKSDSNFELIQLG